MAGMESRQPVSQIITFWPLLFAAAGFAFSLTQPWSFYSNQNQYYLHGLARAGYGDLATDWLANTADPTPIFSQLIASSYSWVGLWPLNLLFFALGMLAFLSLMAIGQTLPFWPAQRSAQWLVAGGLTLIFSAIVRCASVGIVGVDYPWYAQAGIANQYLLGAGLQPSVFGVYLLVSLAAYLHDQPRLAALAIAVTATMHSTYLLTGALLVGGYLADLVWRGRSRQAIITGGLALLGVAPILAYVLSTFRPSSLGEFREAQEILAWVRIPHHTRVAQWLDLVAGVQLLAMVAAGYLCRRSRLAAVLGLPAAGAIALTLIQVLSANATLALLFPWRLSVVLMPLASLVGIIILGHGIERLLWPGLVRMLAGLCFAVAVLGAVIVDWQGWGYREYPAESAVMAYVAEHRLPGECYLVPTRVPPPPKSRGSYSSTFLPKSGDQTRPSIFEFQRFRLATGAAIYVDFKSIPYQDREVLEWWRRVNEVEQWYATPDWEASGVLASVQLRGITHVVIPRDSPVNCDGWKCLYHDDSYSVYRLPDRRH